MTAVRHPGFLKLEILTAGPVSRANMRHQAKFSADRSNVCGDMANFRFFKMAAVRHLGFVLRVFGPLTKSICWSLSLCRIWLESVQWFASLAEKAYSRHFWVVFGGSDPLDETQYQPILQKFHLLIIAVPAVYYLSWCL